MKFAQGPDAVCLEFCSKVRAAHGKARLRGVDGNWRGAQSLLEVHPAHEGFLRGGLAAQGKVQGSSALQRARNSHGVFELW